MDSNPQEKPTGYKIGDVVVDLGKRQVRRDGREIGMGKLSYRLLIALAESAPDVVTPKALAKNVWKGRFVTPATIKQRIVLLRQALGDDAQQPKYVKVVRGHGYAVVPAVEPVFAEMEQQSKWPPRAAGALLGSLLLGLLVVLFLVSVQPARPISVAVLPFANLSPEPDDAYFAAGLHQELIDRLAAVPDLEVISRTSLQRFVRSDTPIDDVAAAFGVDAVMEGTVRYEAGNVQISLHLVDPEDGTQLWSSTYERGFSDIFDIQRDVAASVAGVLGVRLGVSESGTTNVDAYEAYLAGIDMMRRPQGHERGAFFFGRATDLDPEFANAWAQRGFATVITAYFATPEDTRGILEDALSYLLKASDLAPTSPRVAAMMGFARYSLFDWVAAEQDFLRAIELEANRFTLNQHAGMLVRAGRITAAKSEFEAAESVSRSERPPAQLRRHVSVVEERYDEARELVNLDRVEQRRVGLLMGIALNEGDPDTIRNALADWIEVHGQSEPLSTAILENFDDPERALELIREVYTNPDISWPSKWLGVAQWAAYFGDPELALESISKDVSLATVRIFILWYPFMEDVRRLPGFKDLVTSLGLVEYWRAYGWPDHCAPLGEEDFRCW